MTKLREKLQSAAAVFTSSGAAGSVRSRSERFSLQRQILAARVAFFTGGFTVAAWAPLIPFVRNGLLLDEFRLGLLLFGLGLGSFFGMPFAGSLSERYGSRHALAFSGIGSCILLILLATVPNYYVECALLFLYGVVLSSLEVSANIYGTHLERLSGRHLLSGLHAGYSVGEMSAAAVVSLLFMSGASPLCAITIAMTAMALLFAAVLPSIPQVQRSADAEDKHAAVFIIPRGFMLLLCILAGSAFLAEGAMLDWAALYLHDEGGVPLETAGLGYTFFVAAMSISRGLGDRLAERFGSVRVLATGFAMVIASLLVMIVIPTPVTLFAALFIMGLGIANAAPLLISNAAHDPTVNQSSAVTTVTTVGYAGLMAGPALIGFLAHATSLKGAFLCIVVLMSLASIIAHNWRRRFHSPERA